MTYDKDWKLKLRYGKLKTIYQHFGILVSITLEKPEVAFITMKIWAKDSEEATNIALNICEDNLEKDQKNIEKVENIGFFTSDMSEPPSDHSYAYDIKISYSMINDW